jgi:tRNA-(ms[2]io[6]A)-hydroxylase
MKLRAATPEAWTSTAIASLDTFLLDHASAERKASATALSLIVHYPDRIELVDAMVELAQEELQHFAQVYRIIADRGLSLRGDEKDHYVRSLRKLARPTSPEYLLDRLLIAGIIEARGCERFGLIAEALQPGQLKDFYLELTRAEARHSGLFIRLAKLYFETPRVQERLDELLSAEGVIMLASPIQPTLH